MNFANDKKNTQMIWFTSQKRNLVVAYFIKSKSHKQNYLQNMQIKKIEVRSTNDNPLTLHSKNFHAIAH